MAIDLNKLEEKFETLFAKETEESFNNYLKNKFMAQKTTLEIKTVEEIIDGAKCPLPLQVIPNYMGINLVSVDSIAWTRQEDGQLIDLTIIFKSAN